MNFTRRANILWTRGRKLCKNEEAQATTLPNPKDADRALGMDAAITRRDFLASTLLASGSLLLEGLTPAQLLAGNDEWTGYGGLGDYAASNGNTLEVLTAGHTIRDGAYKSALPQAVDTGEIYDCVIVGG